MAEKEIQEKETTKSILERIKKEKKVRVTAHYGIKELYKYYVKCTIPELVVPYKEYRIYLIAINETIVNKLLEESKAVKLGCNVGDIRIRKTKMSFKDTNALRIDWKATKAANKKVYHLNEHREGYRYRFLWYRGQSSGVSNYSFIPTRGNKRRLAKILKTDFDRDYFE